MVPGVAARLLGCSGKCCRFLFDKTCATYKYYDARVQQLERARGMLAAHALAPTMHCPGRGSCNPSPPMMTLLMYRAGSAAREPTQPAAPATRPAGSAEQPAPASGGDAKAGPTGDRASPAAAAQTADDPLAAMQRFERMAAERERAAAARRAAQDDHHDGDRPPEEFLNETAYDRRKQVRVLCTRSRSWLQPSRQVMCWVLTVATAVCRWLCTSGTGRERTISQTVRL